MDKKVKRYVDIRTLATGFLVELATVGKGTSRYDSESDTVEHFVATPEGAADLVKGFLNDDNQ
jgi:hypothetical protein